LEQLKKFLDGMVNRGKISRADADVKFAKHEQKEAAKQKYKKDKAKLNKKDLEALLDILTD
jgi:uncharacterized protein (DUF1919 family)